MLIQLAINGILLALIPLSVVWVSGDTDKFRKLAWITVFLTFDLIVFGAFTRLTDSGLGCPDWPGCYGHSNPIQAHAHIAAAEALLPDGPVTVAKAWIEMIHRYLASAVGVLIISLLVISWRRWRTARRTVLPAAATASAVTAMRPRSPMLAALTLFVVCLQGAFGAWTVTLKLQPIIVTIHLLLAMLLLSMLAWMAAREGPQVSVAAPAAALRLPAAILLAMLIGQIALGGWVSSNYAAMACTEFPLCQGVLVPNMDFEHSFTLWRELGMTAGGDYLPFEALVAIHWVHRMFAFLVACVAVWVAVRALRLPGMEKPGRLLLAALALQFCSGIASVFLQWPLALAVLHSAGGALLVLILLMLNYRARLAANIVLQKP